MNSTNRRAAPRGSWEKPPSRSCFVEQKRFANKANPSVKLAYWGSELLATTRKDIKRPPRDAHTRGFCKLCNRALLRKKEKDLPKWWVSDSIFTPGQVRFSIRGRLRFWDVLLYSLFVKNFFAEICQNTNSYEYLQYSSNVATVWPKPAVL